MVRVLLIIEDPIMTEMQNMNKSTVYSWICVLSVKLGSISYFQTHIFLAKTLFCMRNNKLLEIWWKIRFVWLYFSFSLFFFYSRLQCHGLPLWTANQYMTMKLDYRQLRIVLHRMLWSSGPPNITTTSV